MEGLRTQHSDRAWGGLTLAQTWTQRFFCLFLADPPAKLIQFVQSDPRQLGVHQRRHRAAQCSHPSVFSSWLGCCHLPALDMFPGVYLLSAVSCDSQGYFLPHLDYVTHFWCRECIHLSFVYWRSLMVCRPLLQPKFKQWPLDPFANSGFQGPEFSGNQGSKRVSLINNNSVHSFFAFRMSTCRLFSTNLGIIYPLR